MLIDPLTKTNIVDIAIERLKAHEPPEGFYCAFSGGKDSIVIKKLADIAGIKYDAHFSYTTVDPPEVVKFIKTYHTDVVFDRPKISMFKLIETAGLPTRRNRFCCAHLKECHGKGRFLITGLRWAESAKRKSRRMVEICMKPDMDKKFLHPIIDWQEEDVWEFIRQYELPYCQLYDEGFRRIGCVGCPQKSTASRVRDFERWPNFKKAYLRAFGKMLVAKQARGKPFKEGETPEEVFEWWINEKSSVDENQMLFSLFE
jgi:phosphoadenosine phosphosulfate reductase